MQIKAVQKFVRMSPKKLRIVASSIKELTPKEAVEILPHVRKKAAEPIEKVVRSAIANAKERGFDEPTLIFKEIQINEGPRLKRWRAGARGRVKPYIRRMSHIRVVLETKEVKEITKEKSKKEVKMGEDMKSSVTKRVRKGKRK